MEFDTLILLLAGGWALLNWLMRSARGASRGAEQAEAPDPAELEVRRQRTLERMQARRRERQGARGSSKTEPAQVLDPAERFRREMERIMGVHTEEEHGPLGRRSGVQLEPAEEVEELEPLEIEGQVVSLERPDTRPLRVLIDQDEQAEEIVRRRIAVAEARSKPLTKADHARFDKAIRTSAPAQMRAVRRLSDPARRELRRAVLWSEILSPPVSQR
jgi:hypothetical protein